MTLSVPGDKLTVEPSLKEHIGTLKGIVTVDMFYNTSLNELSFLACSNSDRAREVGEEAREAGRNM